MWEMGTAGRMALPTHVDSVRVSPPDGPVPQPVHAVVTARETSCFDAYAVDAEGHVRVTLRGYRTIELPEDLPEPKRAPIEAAMTDVRDETA
jgi:hypothetical protein